MKTLLVSRQGFLHFHTNKTLISSQLLIFKRWITFFTKVIIEINKS